MWRTRRTLCIRDVSQLGCAQRRASRTPSHIPRGEIVILEWRATKIDREQRVEFLRRGSTVAATEAIARKRRATRYGH
jgi:hypothetical protein